jgi:hypothetical protein
MARSGWPRKCTIKRSRSPFFILARPVYVEHPRDVVEAKSLFSFEEKWWMKTLRKTIWSRLPKPAGALAFLPGDGKNQIQYNTYAIILH